MFNRSTGAQGYYPTRESRNGLNGPSTRGYQSFGAQGGYPNQRGFNMPTQQNNIASYNMRNMNRSANGGRNNVAAYNLNNTNGSANQGISDPIGRTLAEDRNWLRWVNGHNGAQY